MSTRFIRNLLVLLALAAGAAAAADTAPAPAAKPRDADLERARAAIAQGDWKGARGILGAAVQRNPGNADYHNLYAYSVRKGPDPDMSLVFREYNAALAIDPQHKGAHEYLGEAYLMVGNVAKAKEHLAELDKLCFFACSEYAELKNAIAAYEGRQAAR